MKAIDSIIGVGWIVFWAYWLVMAGTAKAGRSRWTRFAGVRVGIILIVLGLLLPSLVPTFAFAHVVLVLGVILLIVGLLLAVMGRMGHAIGGRRHYY